MAPARAFEPADENVIGGIEEQDPHPVLPRGQGVHRRQDLVDVAAPAPHDEGHALHLGAGPVHELGDLGDQS